MKCCNMFSRKLLFEYAAVIVRILERFYFLYKEVPLDYANSESTKIDELQQEDLGL